MKLSEFETPNQHIKNITFDGFKLDQYDQRDDDVIKVVHKITPPEKSESILVDFDSYHRMSMTDLRNFIKFYQKHNRFPNRKDVGSIAPLSSSDLHKVVNIS